MHLFDRANNIAMGQVRSWLPNGRQEGNEWVAVNPTRADNSLGSFKINLTNGKWLDAATDDKGGDLVSLYAYINRAEVEMLASGENYPNYEGGIQAEAAKAILLQYDINYFPDDKDDFSPKKKNEFRQLVNGIENMPTHDLSWNIKNWGEINNTWYFKRKGKTVLKVIRFMLNGKKNDRPFTIWTDGKKNIWKSKSLPGNYPLWNAEELEERQNDLVVLTEGQKTASVLDEVINEKYVCVGWYGGCNAIDKQDWTPLTGREVYFPFDADTSGRKSLIKIKELAEKLDIKLHVVHPPAAVKKGWDLADAIESDGWTSEDIDEFLNRSEKAEEKYIDDDNAFTFKILGYSGESIVFYPYGSKKVVKYRASSLTKGNLFTLMDRAAWGEFYKKDEGGIAWDCAINDLIRRAEEKNVFDSSIVRGTGAWIDNGKLVINTGNNLIIDGELKELYEIDGKYVYERGRYAPFCEAKPMGKESSKKLVEALKLVNWENESSAYFMAGWLLFAPFCGALSWRSNIWMTGRPGSGKSWILSHIASAIDGNFGVMLKGTSTPAGFRQRLSCSALASIIDEMESDNQKNAENIEQNVITIREATSGNDNNGSTAHGTSDGEGRDWIVQTTALLASVGAALRHSADRTRFTILNIDNSKYNIREREERFKTIQEMAEEFTPLWANAFHSRTYKIFDELQKCIKIMSDLSTKILGNRRSGDQIGTLCAGAWMCENDKAPIAAEANTFLEMLDISKLMNDSEDKQGEEQMLDEILSYKIDINSDIGFSKQTIGSCLDYWFYKNENELSDKKDFPGATSKAVKHELEQYGIKPTVKGIQIAVGHPAIVKILRNTAWSNIYSDMLARLSRSAKELKGPGNFGGIRKRFRVIDAKYIIGEDNEPY